MTALLPEWVLKNMIQVARGKVEKESLRYRLRYRMNINLETVPPDLTTEDSLWNWIDAAERYPAWLIDAIEADKMLRHQHQAREDDNLPVPPVLQRYIDEAMAVRRSRGKPRDRDREFESVKLLAKVKIRKLLMSRTPRRFPPGQRHEQALVGVAEKCGMTRDALNRRIYRRKRRVTPHSGLFRGDER